jgi:hypothetical protein
VATLMSFTPADTLVLAAWLAASLVAAVTEALGMRALPATSHRREHLDERPARNRAAVIACAVACPWPPLLDLARRH